MKKQIMLLAAILSAVLFLSSPVLAEDSVILSDDSSDFVLLSDAVPDAILEIRYHSTYNFVGYTIITENNAGQGVPGRS